MAKIDRARDFINNIRLYITIIVAVVLSIGSGATKMYNAGNFNYLFYAAIKMESGAFSKLFLLFS